MSIWEMKPTIFQKRITKCYVENNMPTGTSKIKICWGFKSIGKDAFAGCTGLRFVEIPESVRTIELGSFNGCSSLEVVNIPKSVKSVGDYAFIACTALKSVVISHGVERIGTSAFWNCYNLKLLVIPSSVKSIGDEAFRDCSGIVSLLISEGVKSIGDDAFTGCRSLKSITIPHGVESIGDFAFIGCSNLESIIISSSVKSIGYWIFTYCESLRLIVLPDGLIVKRNNYGIAANQEVISHSFFWAKWKMDNCLKRASYLHRDFLFLYQLQNNDCFKPSWGEILIKHPKIGLSDVLCFSGMKYFSIFNAAQSVDDKMLMDTHRDILINDSKLSVGLCIVSHLTTNEFAKYLCAAKIKNFRLAKTSCVSKPGYLKDQGIFAKQSDISQVTKSVFVTLCAIFVIFTAISHVERGRVNGSSL